MTVSRRWRRTTLTAHVVSSVGWLGAIAASLALALAGLTGDDAAARAAYPALEVVGWYALVPLSAASLVTGLVQGLTSKWGVLRHYWVVTKLFINLGAALVLLTYMQTLGALAATPDARSVSPVLHATGALLLLVIAAILSVFKPPGLTRYGWRRARRSAARIPDEVR